MRVVLVEDSPLMQDQVRRTLEDIPGARLVQVMETEAQAKAWLSAHRGDWDLALVDLFLGQGHGFNVLRKCLDRSAEQHAVVLSNYTKPPVKEYARLAGADAVFDKAFDMEALAAYLVKLSRQSANRPDAALDKSPT